jgi:hypothetical protein
MRLREIDDDHYEGIYRGHAVEITRIGRGYWRATIDTVVLHCAHFGSLERARRECRQAIDWKADKMNHHPPITPGPWTVGTGADVDRNWNPTAKYFVVVNAEGEWARNIAGRIPNEADARLIAVAPKLLKALKEVVAIADRKTVEFDGARAAIDEAEGRS